MEIKIDDHELSNIFAALLRSGAGNGYEGRQVADAFFRTVFTDPAVKQAAVDAMLDALSRPEVRAAFAKMLMEARETAVAVMREVLVDEVRSALAGRPERQVIGSGQG